MMKKLLPLAFIAVACEAMAQEDAQCVRGRAATVDTIRAYLHLALESRLPGFTRPMPISRRRRAANIDSCPPNGIRLPAKFDLRRRDIEIVRRGGLAVEGQETRRPRLNDRAQAQAVEIRWL
jgi:hypothetical protein